MNSAQKLRMEQVDTMGVRGGGHWSAYRQRMDGEDLGGSGWGSGWGSVGRR